VEEKWGREASSSRQPDKKCLLFSFHFNVHCFLNKMSSSNNRQGPPPEQLWKSWDRKAHKQGFRSTIYSSDGSQYKGEWNGDKKNGECVLELNLKLIFDFA
jgi:hypothetical protein